MKFTALLLMLSLLRAAAAPGPELKPGDHIAIIGGTMADRFQHSAWLETYLYAKYPDAQLVFRDLAVPADEVALRHRPEGFGSQDEWLTRVKADVIFAFFGFNESFKGPAGLKKFSADLNQFLKESKEKNYSGKGPVRIVLFSPTACERTRDPNFPDPSRNNANLRLYAAAMEAVARSNNVPFIDLFAPSVRLYAEAARQGRSLTINGFSLTDGGDKLLAQVVAKAFPGNARETDLEKLRGAIIDKNEQWEARYRTIDGNNVYGGRSVLAYAPGKQMIYDKNPPAPYVSNWKVMQEEMAQRDVMTANRDERIWAVAQGRDEVVLDNNLPPVSAVPTDMPASNYDGSATFLGAEEAISKMTVHSNMTVNLFASEEQFPELVSPVQMAWDTRGRLWVAAWKNYPERTPGSKIGDSLLILEDTKGTGRADKITHFMDNLNAPTGFQFYKDGVLLMEAPDLWFVQNVNSHAGAVERILMGMDSADSHHTANSLCLDPGGGVYLSDGVFHRSHVETMAGPVRNFDGAIYRFDPRTGDFGPYISYNFMNPHGRVFDYWGDDLVTDATGNHTYFAPAFSGHVDFPRKHAEMEEFWDRPSRPCAGTGLISSRQFPPDLQGAFLNCNVIGFQGIYLVKVSQSGSGLKGEIQESLVSSSDPNFRPCAVNVGPDGAIYFCDWHKQLIGHMQHHLRDPNRDKEHGRIYRITDNGRPLLAQPKIDGQPIRALLELLKEPENRTRELAKVELGRHETPKVMAALDKWVAGLDPAAPNHEHNLTEALWVCQWHNVVNTNLLARVLRSPQAEARAAAARVLCYWRDRVPGSLALFKQVAEDENPRVRLEAVRAASFYTNAAAAEVALAVVKRHMDYYLDYTLGETLKQLKPWWSRALASGEPFATDNPDGLNHVLGMLDLAELEHLPKSPAVLTAIVRRSAATDADRLNALTALSKASGAGHVAQLFEVFGTNMEGSETMAASFARLLLWQHADELRPHRERLARLAVSNTSTELRRAAWVAQALADGSFENVWAAASKSDASLVDLLEGIPLLNDKDFRAKAYGRVEPMVRPGIDETPELRRAAIHAIASMNYQPATVFGYLTGLIQRGQEVTDAARGMRLLPRTNWPKADAGSAAAGIAAWARTVPADDRTSQDYIEAIQLASDLSSFLPPDEMAAFQGGLAKLQVPVFVIRTVREQMRYDTPRLVVSPRQSIEIRFENVDFMPHNLVIVKPGGRERVGQATAHMKPDELDDEGRAFIADREDILAATRLLETGQKAVLKLKTPSKEGEYEYLCTYPGHYQIMRGQLIVTSDAVKYLAAHPQVVLPPPATTPTSFE
jgi:azurin/glucose/arabinose dehydrogenase